MILSEEIKRAGGMTEWCQKVILQCSVSKDTRREQARRFRMLFHTGSFDGQQRRVNLTRNYVDKLASLLFSPSDLRYELTFDSDEAPDWTGVADLSARHLNREMKVRKASIAFSQALEMALTEGCSFIKLTWGRGGVTPHVIRQHFLGMGREDVNDFADQDVFVHTYYLTEDQLRRLIHSNPRRDAIMEKVQGSFTKSSSTDEAVNDLLPGSYLHEIVVGGQTTGVNSSILGNGSMGTVGVFGPPVPVLAPEAANHLIEINDIWFLNDTANDGAGCWQTIRYCEPAVVIDGRTMTRNLGDLPHTHPFIKISPNEIPGYFWGVSELAFVAYIQEWYANRVGNVDDVFALRARPPRSFEGFSGLTQEKMRALLTRGGTFASDAPANTTRINSLAPDMPSEAMEVLQMIHSSFDEAGGMTPIMQGQGEAGVRAGAHAQQLLRSSTPRLRDRATVVESQVADLGDLAFRIMQNKEGRVFTAEGGKEFTLAQLPEDAVVSVDSHTSSPAFSGDNMQMAFALIKAGAIDGEDLLNMVQPPHVDELILKWRARQKAAAQKEQALMAEAQKDPKIMEKLVSMRGGRR